MPKECEENATAKCLRKKFDKLVSYITTDILSDRNVASMGFLMLSGVTLTCMGNGKPKIAFDGFLNKGMNVPYFLHGIAGFVHYHRKLLYLDGSFCDIDTGTVFSTTCAISRYMAIPSLNAALYSSERKIAIPHMISGLIPLFMYIIGEKDDCVVKWVLIGNMLSLAFTAFKRKKEWGFASVLASIGLYYVALPSGNRKHIPIAMALLALCANNFIKGK